MPKANKQGSPRSIRKISRCHRIETGNRWGALRTDSLSSSIFYSLPPVLPPKRRLPSPPVRPSLSRAEPNAPIPCDPSDPRLHSTPSHLSSSMADSIAPADVLPVFPPADALPRAVLVENISPLANAATLEDFFSFCGSIEGHRLRKVGGVQQAVVIFSDERARENALVMNQSSIIDTQVTITTVPESFNFNDDPSMSNRAGVNVHNNGMKPPSFGMFGSGLAAFGDLFQGVGGAVAAEVEKASKALDKATDTGVLKSAKDQMALVRQKTTDLAVEIDSKWQVRENVKNVAAVSKERATAVASAVASSTSNIATQVDRSLQISENTTMLAERARENPAVGGGIRAVQGGFQTLLAQTGLQHNNNNQTPVDGSHPASTNDSVNDSQSTTAATATSAPTAPNQVPQQVNGDVAKTS